MKAKDLAEILLRNPEHIICIEREESCPTIIELDILDISLFGKNEIMEKFIEHNIIYYNEDLQILNKGENEGLKIPYGKGKNDIYAKHNILLIK